jgi:fucose permease
MKMNWNLILLAYLSLFALSLLDNGRSPTYHSILNDLQIGPAKGSYIFTVASLISLLVNATASRWLPVVGPVKATKFALLLLSISGVSMFATGYFTSYPLLILSSCLMGLGLALCTICMNILVTKGATLTLRKRLFSGLHAIYGLSSFAAPFILALILHLGGNWKIYFLMAATVPVFVIIATSKTKSLNFSESNENTFEKGVSFRNRVLFGLMFGCYVGSELILSSRIPYYLQTYLDYSNEKSGTFLSLFFLSLTAGRLLFSFKTFNIKSQNLLLISYASTLSVFFLGRFVNPLFLSLAGLTMSYAFPVSLDFLVQVFGKKSDYMITSVMTWIGVILAIVHFGFGLINEHYGAENAIFLSPVLSLISVASLIVFLKSDKKVL